MPKKLNGKAQENDTGLEPLVPNTLIIENELLRQGFTSTPNYILRDPSISPAAKTVYSLLLSYAWQEGSCFPGQKRLAVDLGLKERMVRYHIAELKKKGLIEIKRRGLGQTNIYIIKDIFKHDRQYIAGQERQYMSLQDRQNIAYKEYSVEEYSDIQNNVNADEENQKITYFAEILADILKDKKSLLFYKKACRKYDPYRLIQKAKEIIADGGAKKPGAVFAQWLKGKGIKKIGKSVDLSP